MTSFGQFGIDAAVEWGTKAYFFRGTQYIRVSITGPTGPGSLDQGYPRNISGGWGWPDGFGVHGVSAALVDPRDRNNGTFYFFSRGQFVKVTAQGPTGPGIVTAPPQSDEGWFPYKTAAGRITGAVKWTEDTSYFFSGDQYATYHLAGLDINGDEMWGWGTRGHISDWHWPAGFGEGGIDDAIKWGEYVYVFSEGRYIRVHIENNVGPGHEADAGYPRSNSPHWAWPEL
jgi:hypothetical protein